MLEDIDIVLVSNRGPISFVRTRDGWDIRGGAGGLAGALHPVARRLGDRAVWIAATTSDQDRQALQEGAGDALYGRLGYPLYLLDFDPEVYARYYDVVSNRMLWFAEHCLFDELGLADFGEAEMQAWHEGYTIANRHFAEAVTEVAGAGSLLLFQDYHLTLAPKMLRDRKAGHVIFHFTHSAFCGPAGFRRLPRDVYESVIDGMLGADLVGLHVGPWVHGFLDACDDLGHKVDRDAGAIHHDDRITWVRAYPIPIEPKSLQKRAHRAKSQRWVDEFTAAAKDITIVRADRTEPTKNIVRGFDAFERLLDRRPDLRGRISFIACLYPSRQTMPEYRRYKERVEDTVARIEERYPGSIELFMKDDFDRTLGAYRVYDVLLVNSLMDGMNLVSKEGPTLNEKDGVLVLSRTAGSYEELGDQAVTIDDPTDVDATAAALERAIEMQPEERSRRAQALAERVWSRTAEDWIGAQLKDLTRIRAGGQPATPPSP